MSSSSPSSVSTSRWVPERRLRERDRPHVQEVVAVALEARVGRDAHGDVEVAGHATARRGRTPTGEAQTLAVVDAGRHLHVDRLRDERTRPSPRHSRARRGDATAGRAARDARRRGDDLAEDRSADLAHLARATTHVAARRVGAGLAARALAALARDRAGGCRRWRWRRTRPARDRGATTASASGARGGTGLTVAERVATEERVEDVAEAERLAGALTGAAARARTFLAEDVVAPTALGILQRLVRDVDLLELSPRGRDRGCCRGGTGAPARGRRA